VGLVIAYFIYDHWRPRCDAIFEQTTTRVGGNLQLIKATKGELFIGREKMQELAEGPQKVALHLTTCCVAQQVGAHPRRKRMGRDWPLKPTILPRTGIVGTVREGSMR
jgi:hypothetical protein